MVKHEDVAIKDVIYIRRIVFVRSVFFDVDILGVAYGIKCSVSVDAAVSRPFAFHFYFVDKLSYSISHGIFVGDVV